MNQSKLPLRSLLIALACYPLLAAHTNCGNGLHNHAPDMAGEWALEYEDNLDVEITLGGAVYTESLGPKGGAVTIDHNGQPITFDLNCDLEHIVCPSEVWPDSVTLAQPHANLPRTVRVTIPSQSCSEPLVPADPAECGADTLNPDCEDVCDGETVVENKETLGAVDEDGDRLNVFLGAGVASNGINCVALGLSGATAVIASDGGAESDDWTGHTLSDGEIAVGYAGGCLWAGDPNDDGKVEALVIGAGIKFSTGFSGKRVVQ